MGNKSIFITGAGSGIGRATAELFHEKGWFVGCYDVDTAALQRLQEALGDHCTTSTLDVRDKEAFDAAMTDFSKCTDGQQTRVSHDFRRETRLHRPA